jgi:hypothetical protein
MKRMIGALSPGLIFVLRNVSLSSIMKGIIGGTLRPLLAKTPIIPLLSSSRKVIVSINWRGTTKRVELYCSPLLSFNWTSFTTRFTTSGSIVDAFPSKSTTSFASYRSPLHTGLIAGIAVNTVSGIWLWLVFRHHFCIELDVTNLHVTDLHSNLSICQVSKCRTCLPTMIRGGDSHPMEASK